MPHIHAVGCLVLVTPRRLDKDQLDVGPQLRLVLFDHHDVVASGVHNRLRNVFLGQQRIHSHNATLED